MRLRFVTLGSEEKSADMTEPDRRSDETMTHSFEKEYWEDHWEQNDGHSRGAAPAANPYLWREVGHLAPGTALDAGCGTGAEAIALAAHGWRVIGADISSTALAVAAERASQASVSQLITWVETDLTTWQPKGAFDLVVTSYAHAAMPQLAFYERVARWVRPGGTLLIVGHLPAEGAHHSHGHPPVEATATSAAITVILPAASWVIESAYESARDAGTGQLHDVVVRARRRSEETEKPS